MLSINPLAALRQPERPRDDPFYDAPRHLDALTPGTIIRARSVDLKFLGLIRQSDLKAWQLAYRSTDLHGRAEVAVTTVISAEAASDTPPRGLIAYQCAIDAVSDKCFPSYALRAPVVGAIPSFELIFMRSMIEQGFLLSVSDHEGRHGSFGAPREPGHRVLDGVRASLAFSELDLTPRTPVGIFGYSGGGMASAWAAEMASTYAPEVDLVGAVLGSPVGDPGEAFIKLNATFFAGLPALVVAGLVKLYPELAQVIDENSTLQGRRRLRQLENPSTLAAVLRHRHDDFDDYLTAPLADVLASTAVMNVFADIRLGNRTPTCPLLVVQAVRDQIIDVRDIDALVDRYVEGGSTIRYVRDSTSEHIGMLPVAQPFMMRWLSARFDQDEAIATETSTVPSLTLAPQACTGYQKLARTTWRVLRAGAHELSANPPLSQGPNLAARVAS